jgi:hypothetical protein
MNNLNDIIRELDDTNEVFIKELIEEIINDYPNDEILEITRNFLLEGKLHFVEYIIKENKFSIDELKIIKDHLDEYIETVSSNSEHEFCDHLNEILEIYISRLGHNNWMKRKNNTYEHKIKRNKR